MRISTDEAHQKHSLEAQRIQIEDDCLKRYGKRWVLFEVFRDTQSGAHHDRPGLAAMLRSARAGKFDRLVVFRVDRLSRRLRDLLWVLDTLAASGVAVHSVSEPFDSSTSAGRTMTQMLGVFAEFERASIIDRVKLGQRAKAKAGRFVGGSVPYGYQLRHGQGLVVIPSEAAVVKMMFKLCVFWGIDRASISRKLSGLGYRKRSGRSWRPTDVSRIVRNPTYAGRAHWGSALCEGRHEAIVPRALFAAAQDVISKRRRKRRPGYSNKNPSLLAGTVSCGCCGRLLRCSNDKRAGVRYYRSSSRPRREGCGLKAVPAEFLDQAVMAGMKALYLDRPFIRKVWQGASHLLKKEEARCKASLSKIRTDAKGSARLLEKYLAAFDDGTLSPRLCGDKIDELRATAAELAESERTVEARRDSLKMPRPGPDRLAGCVAQLESVVASGENQQKRFLLQFFLKRVILHVGLPVEIILAVPDLDRFPAFADHDGCRHAAPASSAASVCFGVRIGDGGCSAPGTACVQVGFWDDKTDAWRGAPARNHARPRASVLESFLEQRRLRARLGRPRRSGKAKLRHAGPE